MSVVDVLEACPGPEGATALVGPGASWSYGELRDRVTLRAAEFARTEAALRDGAHGVEPLVVPRAVDLDARGIVDLLSLWSMGVVPAPLNVRLTEPEREEARRSLAGAALPGGTQVVLWTSGTSGRPRGVALSWENLVAITHASKERLGLEPGDVWLASLSPAHVGGLVLVVRTLLLGGTLVAPGGLEVPDLSRLLDGDGGMPAPTHLSLVPTQLRRLLRHRAGRAAPEALRCVLVGGAHAPEGLVARALEEGWPVALTYGATEMSSQIATAPPELVRRLPGTVGHPMPGVELRMAEDGEILARGATRALAYLGGEAALADGEGWYHTGDLGTLDDLGRLRITGRRMDRIVSGGVTVDAVEVEEALRAHPAVLDACVAGVPDEEWGERVGAWVEPVEGEFDLEEVERHLRDRLAGAKVPRLWRMSGGLPRNANGKVDRGAVRRILSESRSTDPA